jgi:hypothetical protein
MFQRNQITKGYKIILAESLLWGKNYGVMGIHRNYLEFKYSNMQTIGQIAIDAFFFEFRQGARLSSI